MISLVTQLLKAVEEEAFKGFGGFDSSSFSDIFEDFLVTLVGAHLEDQVIEEMI